MDCYKDLNDLLLADTTEDIRVKYTLLFNYFMVNMKSIQILEKNDVSEPLDYSGKLVFPISGFFSFIKKTEQQSHAK